MPSAQKNIAKKIIYLAVNSSYSHFSPAYGMLRAWSEEHSSMFEWDIVDSTINDNIDIIIRKILCLKPDIIVSTLYLFNHFSATSILRRIKTLKPNICIILGGPEFLGGNEQFLKDNPEIHAVFRGDESPLPEFLKRYSELKQVKDIPGLCAIYEGKYYDNGIARFNMPLDSLPSFYEKGYFPSNKPFIHFETSRGCPSACSFCVSSLSGGLSLYGIERVTSDLDIVYKAGIRNVRLLDRTFNMPSGRAVQLIELFNTRYPGMQFHLEIEPAMVDEHFLRILSESPVHKFHIEAGVQTFCEDTLEKVCRKRRIDRIEENLKRLCALLSGDIHTDLIAGLPGQTIDTVIKDVEKLIMLGPEEIQLEVLKMLPGTPITNEYGNSIKYSKQPPYEVLETDTISFPELTRCSALSKIIDSCYNSSYLKNLFRYAVMTCPGFTADFLDYAEERFGFTEKPSLSSRFSLFSDYAVMTKNELLSELSDFACVMSGFFNPSLKGLALTRKDCIAEGDLAPVWSNTDELLDKPAYIFSSSFNVAEVWKNPERPVIRGGCKYYIRLSSAKQNRKPARVDLIEDGGNLKVES